jgi:hypothetical protein
LTPAIRFWWRTAWQTFYRPRARFGADLISAISAQGQLRFMLTTGRVTASVFIEFLRRSLINATAPIFAIGDDHPTHRAKSATQIVAAQQQALLALVHWASLAGTESGRIGMERSEDPRNRTQADHLTDTAATASHAIRMPGMATIVGSLIT